jgi:hypothetical protein
MRNGRVTRRRRSPVVSRVNRNARADIFSPTRLGVLKNPKKQQIRHREERSDAAISLLLIGIIDV